MKDGRRNDCAECNKALRKKKHAKNREAYIARAKKWQRENRDRHLARHRQRRAENREELRQRDRRGWLARKYSLTPEAFEELLQQHNGACAICGRVMGKDLHVDHDHGWNAVRGLLCGSCNRGIGLLQENPALLKQAADYLTDHKVGLYKDYIQTIDQIYEKALAQTSRG